MAGFVLIFFIFPILCIVGLIMLYYGEWILLLKVAIVCVFLIVLLCSIVAIFNYKHSKIELTRGDTIGKYEIDTLLYPGKNSQWQFKTFTFEITDKDSILFKVKFPDKEQIIKGNLKYSSDKPYLFHISNDTPKYHILQYDPTFHRGHDRFYLSFSTKYNTMFFRKKQ